MSIKWVRGFGIMVLLLAGFGFWYLWVLGQRATGRHGQERSGTQTVQALSNADGKVVKSEAQWKTELSDLEYRVLREKGTERAFTGDLYDHQGDGIYTCAACGQALFDSRSKFESGTGWPSFYEPLNTEAVDTAPDKVLFITQTEVVCPRCDSHLGHVFEDGPPPTGLRYCINSCALDFVERGRASGDGSE